MWFHIIIETTKIFFKALALLDRVPLVWHHFTRINDFCRIFGKASYVQTFAYYELGYEQVAPWTPPMDPISLACMTCMLYIGCNRAQFTYNGCKGSLQKKKRSKVEICPNRVGGSRPRSQFLNRFLKNAQNALKHVKNTKKLFFSFLGGQVSHLEIFIFITIYLCVTVLI